MKDKDTNNRYIFRYAAILVVIVALLLSAASVLLSPLQKRNQDDEKMKNILSAAGVDKVDDDNASGLFKAHCTAMLLIDSDGNIVDQTDKAFNTDIRAELDNKQQGLPYVLPLFVISDEGRNVSVIPLQGNGLWGAIWGYIAIDDDYETVVGTNFDHASETPGLGGEITSEGFRTQFKGKTFMQNGNFVSIKVQKGGIMTLPESDRQHAVDAISGGTITSKGVASMISNVLGCYLPYFDKQKKQQDYECIQ